MTCPYCGKEMEQGYINTPARRGPILWSDEQSPFRLFVTKEEITLSGFFEDDPPAWLCRDCRKIVMEY